MVNWTGEVELELQKKGPRTVPNKIFHHGALKLMRPFYLDDSDQAYYTLLNPGGGYLNGDQYKIRVTLQKNAAVFLATQSATKIYKSPDNPVYQESEFILKDKSTLHYLPDPIIAYSDAQFIQKNIIKMSSDSTVFFSEIITPGWSEVGRYFTYKRIQMRNEIYVDNKLIALDHLRLLPSQQNIFELGYMEGHTHLGTCFIISPCIDRDNPPSIDQLVQRIRDNDSCQIGLSHLETSGYVVRVLADDTQVIEHIFNLFLKQINNLLNRDTVSLRKY